MASKVFYHLEEHDEALRLALEAGPYFDITVDSQYVLTLVHKCIDIYTAKRVALVEKKDKNVVIDPKMEAVVNKKFETCFVDGKFKQAIGIALETRRTDMVQASIERSENPDMMLGYTYTLATETIRFKQFRTEVLQTILLIYQRKQDGKNLDYYKIAKCQFVLNLPESTSILLQKLIDKDD